MELNSLFGLRPQYAGFDRLGLGGSKVFDVLRDGTPTLESVIGVDERARVPDTTDDPWRKVCALTIVGTNGAVARGTGWFIGPRTLLTAGHCVYSTVLFGGWAKEILVQPGRDSGALPYGSALSTWFLSLADWVATESPDSDVGCIQLDSALGDAVGWFDLDTPSDVESGSTLVTIAGYPVDRDDGNVMYYSSNRLLRSTATQLFYDVDTVGGQSGAPIWVADGASARVIGIHAYGASGDLDPILGVETNSGRRLTSELLATISGWLRENR